MSGESWSDWFANGAVWTGIGGLLTFLGGSIWKAIARRDALEERQIAREDSLQRHNSALAIELLQITKAEAGALRQQVSELQAQVGTMGALERRLEYFEEALLHIEALLGGDGGREAAEHNARLFMAKMVALRQVKGIAANAEQVERAKQRRIEKNAE